MPEAVDGGERGRLRGPHRGKQWEGDEPQDRALQPEDREEAAPPEGPSMGGAHRLVASVFPVAMIAAKDVPGETRPHSVVSTVTSQDRGVNVGDRRQYSHASRTKPRPQQTSATLAS